MLVDSEAIRACRRDRNSHGRRHGRRTIPKPARGSCGRKWLVLLTCSRECHSLRIVHCREVRYKHETIRRFSLASLALTGKHPSTMEGCVTVMKLRPLTITLEGMTADISPLRLQIRRSVGTDCEMPSLYIMHRTMRTSWAGLGVRRQWDGTSTAASTSQSVVRLRSATTRLAARSTSHRQRVPHFALDAVSLLLRPCSRLALPTASPTAIGDSSISAQRRPSCRPPA